MKSKGFTLIELAVVLAIIAVLAAVLTPVVTNYVDQARVTRAQADTRTIADAIRLYQRDTGFYPIYSNRTGAGSDTTATHLLIGPGQAHNGTNHADWTGFTAASDLTTIVNSNVLGLSTGSQVTAVGRAAYRGPYLGAVDTDPWGNRYTVTATNLKRSSTDWAFVISSGADGELDTDALQGNSTTFAVLGDDVVAIIK